MAESFSVKAILSAEDSGFTSVFDKAESTVSKFSSSIKDGLASFGNGILTGAGISAFNGISNAVGGLASGVVQMGTNFDSAMSNVGAISGATGKDLTSLTDKAKEMGAKTKFSATESAEAMSYMAMAGWKTKDMLSGIEGIMNLAAASGESLATTSDIVTDDLTAFGKTAADSNRLADIMAATSSNANTNVSLMGESFKYAASTAGSMGYSMEDTAKAIGLMANSGVKGSMAGTSLKNILVNLAKPTDNMKTAMDKLGISLTDNKGNMKSLDTVMGDLRTSFSKLTPAQKAQYAATLAGKEGMAGLLAIVNASPADYDKLTKAIASSSDGMGAAAQMAETMQDNFEGDVTIMKSAWEGFSIGLWDSIKGPMRSVVQNLTSMIGEMTNAISNSPFISKVAEVAANVANGLLNTIQDLAPKIGSALQKVYNFAAPIVKSLAKQVKTVVPQIKSAIKSIGKAMLESKSPIGWIAKAFSKLNGNKIASGIDKITGAFSKLNGFITKNSSAIGTIAGWAIPALIAGRAFQKLTGHTSGLGKSMTKTGSSAKGFGQQIAIAAATVTGCAILLDKAGSGAQMMFTGMTLAIGGLIGITALAAPNLQKAAKGMQSFGKMMVESAAAFAIMSAASIALNVAGGASIATFFGMAAAMGGLLAIAGALGPSLSKGAAGMQAFGVMMVAASAGFAVMTASAIALSNAGSAAIGTFFGMQAALAGLLAVAGALGPSLTAGAAGLAAFGAMMIMAGAGMTLMANASIQLASAGSGAIATFFGMQAAMAGLLAVVGVFGPTIAAAALGLSVLTVAVTACVAVVAASSTQLVAVITAMGTSFATAMSGIATAAQGIGDAIKTAFDGVADIITSVGNAITSILGGVAGVFTGVSTGIMALTTSLTMISAGAMTASTGLTALGTAAILIAASSAAASASLAMLGAVLMTAGTAATVAGAQMTAFSAGVAVVSTGLATISTGAAMASAGLATISTGASTASTAMTAMSAAIVAASAQMVQIGVSGTAAMTAFVTAVNSGGHQAVSSMTQSVTMIVTTTTAGMNRLGPAASAGMSAFNGALSAGGSRAVSIARSIVNSINAAFRAGAGAAAAAGAAIGAGLARGLSSQVGAVQAAASRLAAAANAAIAAKAKIGSPSKVTTRFGKWYGEGWINGISDRVNEAHAIAARLVDFPQPDAYHGGTLALSGDYLYGYNNDDRVLTIEVPLTIDGRQVAKATASYTQQEINAINRRASRKVGRL